MQIDGEWRKFPDGVTRPVVLAEVVGHGGIGIGVRFLVDSGADRTVFNAALTSKLNLPTQPAEDRIQGVAGDCDYVTMQSVLEFRRDGGGVARVRGEFLGLTEPRDGPVRARPRCARQFRCHPKSKAKRGLDAGPSTPVQNLGRINAVVKREPVLRFLA